MKQVMNVFCVLPFLLAGCSSMDSLVRQQQGLEQVSVFLVHTPDPVAGEDLVDIAKLYYGHRSYAGLLARHNQLDTSDERVLTTWWGSVMNVASVSGKNLPPDKPLRIPFHTVMREEAESIAERLRRAGDRLVSNQQFTLAVERYQSALEINADIRIPRLSELPVKWRNQVRFYQKKRDPMPAKGPGSSPSPSAGPSEPSAVIAQAKRDIAAEKYAQARQALTGINHPEARSILAELKEMAESLYTEGLAEYRQQTEEGYQTAIAKWRLALECNPGHTQAKQSLVQAQERVKQIRKLE